MTYDELIAQVSELQLSEFDKKYLERARNYLASGMIIPETIRAQLMYLWTTAKPKVCIRLTTRGNCRWLSRLEFHQAVSCPFYARKYDPRQCQNHSFGK